MSKIVLRTVFNPPAGTGRQSQTQQGHAVFNGYRLFRMLVILFIGSCLLSSCVSKKKYDLAVQNFQSQQNTLSNRLSKVGRQRDSLNIELARTMGANEALLITQDKLQARIDELQAEVENIGNTASSRQQSLNSELDSRNAEITALQNRLEALGQTIDRWENAQAAIAQEITLALQPFDANLCAVDQRGGEVIVVLNEDLLFRTGSTSRFEQQGIDALQAVSAILAKYPSLYVQVVGHTDNRSVARKSLDNWDYSLLRAGNVAKLLIDEFDLGANRILPGGKSEYAPRTSNETEDGRAQNRRIELILTGSGTDLARELRRTLR
jgi:flagellar motor protein MotB